jgi:hypothetical protein
MATSYANAGGAGDRTASVIATTNISFAAGSMNSLIDGSRGGFAYFNTQAAVNKYMKFDFQSFVQIDEFTWYQQNATSHGVCAFQRSLDNVNWFTIGTLTFGGGTTVVTTFDPTHVGRYWRLFWTSGTISNSPYVYEIEFKIETMLPYRQYLWATRDRFRATGISIRNVSNLW